MLRELQITKDSTRHGCFDTSIFLYLRLEHLLHCSDSLDIRGLHPAILAPQAFLVVCVKHRQHEVLNHLCSELRGHMLN